MTSLSDGFTLLEKGLLGSNPKIISVTVSAPLSNTSQY